MGIENAADLAAFCNPDEFGDLAILSRVGGIAQEILGVFTSASTSMLDGYGAPVMGMASNFLASSADVDLVARQDGLQVRGVDYLISDMDINIEGGGMTRLYLEVDQ